MYQSAVKLARTDSLTGALNRTSLESVFQQEIARAKRNKSKITVLMLGYWTTLNKSMISMAMQLVDQALIALTQCIKRNGT